MKKVLAYFKTKKAKKRTDQAASFAKSHSGVGQPVIPDPELQYSFEAIKLLGQGSTGQTWLCKECKTSELVAVKLIPRPFPKALLPSHVEREIKVRTLLAPLCYSTSAQSSCSRYLVEVGEMLQIQTELGDSHINIINALEVILTSTNLALVLEYAQGSSLTHYVGQRWQHAQHTGAFLSEDESRYLFRVRLQTTLCCSCVAASLHSHRLLTALCCSNSFQPWSTATSTTWLTGPSRCRFLRSPQP